MRGHDRPMQSEITRRGLLLVLSSPSGAGKTSITRLLVERDHALDISVSVTTRAPRAGEIDGKHYRFIDAAEFARMIAAGGLLGDANVFCYRSRPPPGPRRANPGGRAGQRPLTPV